MIESDKRKAILFLHEEGMGLRTIARNLSLSRTTVKRIILKGGALPQIERGDRIQINPERIGELYVACKGFVKRIQEKLADEDNFKIGYSTLTRLVREMGLVDVGDDDKRHSKVPDRPGAEMQHDTSPYEVTFKNGKKMKVAGSLLYLRYSKMRYFKFYPSFTRFRMKCFFHEALTHFGCCAGDCIIDNTNLAVLRGTGPDAIMVPEMIEFAKSHGNFKWKAHRIRHSDRKAGVERGFRFVETNFFTGREFEDLEDLNRQALDWSTVKLPVRPHSKTKLIPVELFSIEKPHLKRLPGFMPEPLLSHERGVDQYGYAAFDGNYYWVPGKGRGKVQVTQYSGKIRISRDREILSEYQLPVHGIKNGRFPEGPLAPKTSPSNCKKPTEIEEIRLRAIDPIISDYIDFILKSSTSSFKRHRLIRSLFHLSRKLASELLIQTVSRALRYRILETEIIERIAAFLMRESVFEVSHWEEGLSDDPAWRSSHEGCDLSEIPDLSRYDKLLDDEGNEGVKNNGQDNNGQGS